MRTLVPNEMLLNPAVSIISASNTSGPLNIAADATLDGSLVAGRDITARNMTANSDLSVTGEGYFGNKVTIDNSRGLEVVGQTQLDGNLLFAPNNTYDIGGAAGGRPRNIYQTGYLQSAEIATPATPGASNVRIYPKADHRFYALDSTGTETPLGGATQAQNDARYLALTGGTLTGSLLFSPNNTYDIGASGANRPRDVYITGRLYTATGIWLDNGSVAAPIGLNSSGLLLGNIWQINSSTGAFGAQTDNSFDIGASAANRPRDLSLGRNLSVNGTTVMGATGSDPSTRLIVGGSGTGAWALTTQWQFGIYAQPTFSSAATTTGTVIQARLLTINASFTMANGYVVFIDAPGLGAGSVVSNLYGLRVQNQGKSGITNAYGIFIAAQSGAATDNYALYAQSQSWFQNGLGIGSDNYGNPLANTYLFFNSSFPVSLTGTSQYGIRFGTIAWNAPTVSAAVISTVGAVQMQGAAATLTNHYHLQIGTMTPNGWTITNAYGINVVNQGAAGVVNAYGLYIAAQSGAAATNVGLYNAGTTQLMGNVGIGTPSTATSMLTLAASSAVTSGTSQTGISLGNVFMPSTATASYYGIYVGITTQTTTFTCGIAANLYAGGFAVGAGTTITNTFGLYVASQGGTGVVNAYGIWINPQTGGSTSNIALYIAHTNGSYAFPAIQLVNSAFISAKNNVNVSVPVYVMTGDNYNCFFCGTAGMLFANSTNTVRLGTLDNSGNLGVNGNLTSFAGNLFLYNATTYIASDSVNLLFFATGGAFYTRASAIYCQTPAGAYAPVYASVFSVQSTRKSKQDLVPLNQRTALAQVLDERVAPLTFRYTTDPTRHLGFVAEDMLRVVPEVVTLDDMGDPQGIHYGALVPILWGAVRELSARLAVLENAA